MLAVASLNSLAWTLSKYISYIIYNYNLVIVILLVIIIKMISYLEYSKSHYVIRKLALYIFC